MKNYLDPEDLEGEVSMAYPGLPEFIYQCLAAEALKRYDDRAKAVQWALTSARLALLEESRKERERETRDRAIWID